MQYSDYAKILQEKCDEEYALANLARKQGQDPKDFVEIPQAHDLADRTQKLLNFLHPRDTASQIRELTELHDGNRELVALEIGKIVSAESYLFGALEKCPACKGKGYTKSGWREKECLSCKGAGFDMAYTNIPHWKETLEKFKTVEKFENDDKIALSIYHGVCAGLAVLTEGILVAPLEGVASARIISNQDGTKCISISYAGPVRSAGGTGQALSVLIADIVRRNFKLSKSIVTTNEIERYKEEVSAYARGLQFRPSNPQLLLRIALFTLMVKELVMKYLVKEICRESLLTRLEKVQFW